MVRILMKSLEFCPDAGTSGPESEILEWSHRIIKQNQMHPSEKITEQLTLREVVKKEEGYFTVRLTVRV